MATLGQLKSRIADIRMKGPVYTHSQGLSSAPRNGLVTNQNKVSSSRQAALSSPLSEIRSMGALRHWSFIRSCHGPASAYTRSEGVDRSAVMPEATKYRPRQGCAPTRQLNDSPAFARYSVPR